MFSCIFLCLDDSELGLYCFIGVFGNVFAMDISVKRFMGFFVLQQPTEHNTYADIEAAYSCLEKNLRGSSTGCYIIWPICGSGPTLELAARLPSLRAVVLHSPILSGLRVMYPVKRTYWFDIYKFHSHYLKYS
ncbi:hypothetical protein KSP40_PGU017995 [Platanthera guangdongensis]|uniref:Uncharacterized protein n=1 Tax=Platanthera guangdongensis TaxID=2320717 RepID=A0ABR2LV83_9ASPA